MSIGAAVWVAIGSAWLACVLVTRLVRRLPGIESVVHGLLGSWLGRAIALAAWAEAGWHIFGQRP